MPEDAQIPIRPTQSEPDDRDLRKKAARRCWVCPGVGFALLGHPRLAVWSFVASVGALLAAAGAVIWPNRATIAVFLVAFLAALVLGTIEQLGAKRLRLGTPGPRLLVAGFPYATAVTWLSVAVLLGLFFSSFGSLR